MKYTAIFEYDPKQGIQSMYPPHQAVSAAVKPLEQTPASLEEAIGLYLEALTARGEPLPADEPVEVRVLEIAV